MTIEALGAIAASVMSIAGLIVFLINPVLKLNKAINELNLTIKLLGKDLDASKEDRIAIHAQLIRQDTKLDDHELKLAEHSQQIKTLFKGER